jgi:hypothetical protein
VLAPKRDISYGIGTVVLRLLLAIAAALTLVSASPLAYAASGLHGESTCCCPEPSKCKCHDHERERDGEPASMSRCSGSAEVVPLVAVAYPHSPTIAVVAPARRVTVAGARVQPPEPAPPTEIETPPF